MAKRRTRKQKKTAHHQFTVSWTPSQKTTSSEANVKRQFTSGKNKKLSSSYKRGNANISALDINIATVKREIRKSLILAAAIVGMELVLYLVWH